MSMLAGKFSALDQIRSNGAMQATMHRLFARLKKWINIRGIDQEADKRLAEMPLAVEWWTGVKEDDSPQTEILNAFRECGELWLEAAPADVVVIPRQMFATIVGALPPLPEGPFKGLPTLSADDWARIGRDHVINAADARRAYRERAEFEEMREARRP